jgi:hypothetical protein
MGYPELVKPRRPIESQAYRITGLSNHRSTECQAYRMTGLADDRSAILKREEEGEAVTARGR